MHSILLANEVTFTKTILYFRGFRISPNLLLHFLWSLTNVDVRWNEHFFRSKVSHTGDAKPRLHTPYALFVAWCHSLRLKETLTVWRVGSKGSRSAAFSEGYLNWFPRHWLIAVENGRKTTRHWRGPQEVHVNSIQTSGASVSCDHFPIVC